MFATVPVTVEYELTEGGKRLEGIVRVMQDFGQWLRDREAVHNEGEQAAANLTA